MTTAAESPGAEVQQGKFRLWNWILLSLGLFVVWLFVAAVYTFSEPAYVMTAEGEAKAGFWTLEINLARYKTLTNKYPGSLVDMVHRPEGFKGKWRQFMLEASLTDPWGEPWQYRSPSPKNPDGYDLFSKGPDKTEGTPDDIRNWQ